MSRPLPHVLLALVAGLLISACGDVEGGSAASPVSRSTPPAQTAAPEVALVTPEDPIAVEAAPASEPVRAVQEPVAAGEAAARASAPRARPQGQPNFVPIRSERLPTLRPGRGNPNAPKPSQDREARRKKALESGEVDKHRYVKRLKRRNGKKDKQQGSDS